MYTASNKQSTETTSAFLSTISFVNHLNTRSQILDTANFRTSGQIRDSKISNFYVPGLETSNGLTPHRSAKHILQYLNLANELAQILKIPNLNLVK
jgi:hypothetical protein